MYDMLRGLRRQVIDVRFWHRCTMYGCKYSLFSVDVVDVLIDGRFWERRACNTMYGHPSISVDVWSMDRCTEYNLGMDRCIEHNLGMDILRNYNIWTTKRMHATTKCTTRQGHFPIAPGFRDGQRSHLRHQAAAPP
jgi:hypothetical protein